MLKKKKKYTGRERARACGGRRSSALESACATHWSRAQHAGEEPSTKEGSVICNIRRKLCSLRWHFSHDQPAMWIWWESWRKSLALWTDARLQVVQQICMLVVSRTWLARSWIKWRPRLGSPALRAGQPRQRNDTSFGVGGACHSAPSPAPSPAPLETRL